MHHLRSILCYVCRTGSCDLWCRLYLCIVCREAQEVFIAERDGDEPGHEWERVSKMCDFGGKGSKCTKDVSRMRSIFLHLKQDPLVR